MHHNGTSTTEVNVHKELEDLLQEQGVQEANSANSPMDTLQVNDEGRQVLLMQQPAHAQHIFLPSAQFQHLPNQVAATTQQQIQAGGLWFGVTQANGMYFQSNQPIAQATLPINAAPPRYVSPMYTQVQIGNQNYGPLEMNPATALFARPNYVMHPSSLNQSNDSMLAPVRGSISGTPHLDPVYCGDMLHGRSNLGIPRVASTTIDSFCVQDKMSTGLFDSNILGPTNVLPAAHGTFQDLLRSASSRTAVESILTEGMIMQPEKNPNGYRPSSTNQISNEGATNNHGKDAFHVTPDSPSRLVVDESGYASSESSLYDVDSDDENDALGFENEDNIEGHNLASSSECPVNNNCNASEQVPSSIIQGGADLVEDYPCVNGNPFMHVMTEVTEDITQTVAWKKRVKLTGTPLVTTIWSDVHLKPGESSGSAPRGFSRLAHVLPASYRFLPSTTTGEKVFSICYRTHSDSL